MSTSTPSVLRIAGAHAKLNLLENFREPIAIIGTTVFPTLALLFFVVPQSAIADDRVAATGAAAQLGSFAVMSVCIFTFGIGIAEDRARPFDGYVRSLPAGPLPQFLGRLRTGVLLMLMGLAAVTIVAFALTEARLSPDRLLLTLGALLLGALPLLLIGFAVGYTLTQKSAIAVAQLLFFGFAFGGGMFVPPDGFPSWLDAISQWLPSRSSRDLVVWAVGSGDVAVQTFITLALWTALGAALTVWGFRRDEGRRFH